MKRLLLVLALLAVPRAQALDVELFEQDETHLGVRLSAIDTDRDRELAARYRSSPELAVPTPDGDVFSITLDSKARIAAYLKAARLSRGVYVHLPALCPGDDCAGIRFTVSARHILFGDTHAPGRMTIEASQAAGASVFLTNEHAPRIRGALYVGPEFTDASADRLVASLDAIARSYREIAGRDLLAHVGILATTAVNDGGYTGFGGDSLNLVRLTYDNPNGESQDAIVQAFVTTFAHETAHKLQGDALHRLAHGRLVAEGSADFLKVWVLLRAGVVDAARATEMVRHAWDECERQRGSQGLAERIASRAADYREYYDCGMVDYFALAFLSRDGVDRFVPALLQALASVGQPAAVDGDGDGDACMLLDTRCPDPVMRDLQGDARAMAARRPWFDAKWTAFAAQPPGRPLTP